MWPSPLPAWRLMSDRSLLQLHDAIVNLKTGVVLRGDAQVSLTGRELALLQHLVAHAGRTVSRNELLETVFGFHPHSRTRVVATTLRRLRSKLGEDPAQPTHLVTVYGEGIRFEGVHPAPPSANTTMLFGREAELAHLMSSPAQVIALTGCGGVGKSALARGLLSMRRGWFVDLSSVDSIDDIPEAINATLGMFAQPLTGLGKQLAGLGSGWIVLDNLDTLYDTVGDWIAPWLAAAPKIRWLLTGRRRFRLPFAHDAQRIGPLSSAAALDLLQHRLQKLDLDGSDPDTLREVIALTGAIPLAIELTAARARLVGVHRLAEHLAAVGLRELGSRTEGRHTSVLAAVQGSLDLLSDAEREGLEWLACFPVDFPIDAALSILGEGGLLTLESLQDANLLSRSQRIGRLRLYVTVREAVQAQGPSPAAWRAYIGWAARFAGARHTKLRSPEIGEALAELEEEWPALLMALSKAEHDPEAGLRLAEALSEALRWSSRGLPPEATLAAFRAIPLAGEADQRRRIVLATIAAAAHRPAEGLTQLGTVADLPPSLQLEAAELRLRLLWAVGQKETLLQEAPRAIADAQDRNATLMEGRLTYHFAIASDPSRRGALLLRARTLLEAADDHGATINALASWGRVVMKDDRRPRAAARVLRQAVEMFAEWPPTRNQLQIRLLYADALLTSREHQATITLCKAVQQDAVRWGIPSRAVNAEVIRGAALLDGGHPGPACEVLEACLPAALQGGWFLALAASWRLGLSCITAKEMDRAVEVLAHILRITRPLSKIAQRAGLALLSALAAAGGAVELSQAAIERADDFDADHGSMGVSLLHLPLERACLRRTTDAEQAARLRERIRARLDRANDPNNQPEGSYL
ncbi:MAG: winged helix-turn-helix domain-containing protein, partial [Myxococcota bacterium]